MEIRKSTDPKRTQSPSEQRASKVPGPQPHAESLLETKEATLRAMTELQRAQNMARPSFRDEVALSETAKSHLADNLHGEALRDSLVEELRDAYQAGTLNSNERIETAARRLLGGGF